jgi:hypothetical protein
MGGDNAFFGTSAGFSNTAGSRNAFFGRGAGASNTTENNNTFIGAAANGAAGITNATAIGYHASVTQSNSLVLGSVNGANGATAGTNVGIGTTTPAGSLHVVGNSIFATSGTNGVRITPANDADIGVLNVTDAANSVNWLTVGANGQVIMNGSGNVGIGTTGPAVKLHVVGDIRVGTSGTNGCVQGFDGTALTGSCSSDARLKRDIRPFPRLLDKVTKLQPVHYYWRAREFPNRHFGDSQSYGLVAQEVERVLPELVGEDAEGYKTVDYSKLPLMLLQSIKELKAENDALKQRLQEQDERLRRLEHSLRKAER